MRTIESMLYLGAITLAISIHVVCLWPSQRKDASSSLPKPSFVLHDKNLHAEKPHTILSPNGSFTISAGTSMIEVSSLSFSADGKLLAVGSTPGIVDVWNLETRQKVHAFKGGTAVALSSDGRILEKDGNGIEIIDLPSGSVKRTIPWSSRMGSEDHTIQSVTMNPNNTQILVASNGQDLKVFDVTSGALLATLTNTRRGTFSPDGSLVVGGDYRHLMTWNAKNWEIVRDLPNAGPGYVTTVASDPAHDIEVVGGSQSARLLKLTTGAQLGTFGDATNFAAISNTGSLIFTYTSRGFAIWDATGRLRCLKPGDSYYTMAISPDNRWLAAAPSNQLTDVAVWDLTEVIAACSSDAAVSGGPTKVANGKITWAAVTEPVRPLPQIYFGGYPLALIRTYFVQNSFYSQDKHSGLAVRNEVLLHYVIQRRLTTIPRPNRLLGGSVPEHEDASYSTLRNVPVTCVGIESADNVHIHK